MEDYRSGHKVGSCLYRMLRPVVSISYKRCGSFDKMIWPVNTASLCQSPLSPNCCMMGVK